MANGNGGVSLVVLREKLAEAAHEVKPLVPAGCGVMYEGLCASALAIVGNEANAKLRTCSVESIVRAVGRVARLGLDLDPVLGQAYLTPRWNKYAKANECQIQMGYRGLLALAMRSPRLSHAVARIVFEKDDFVIDLGSDKVRHRPCLDDDRGGAKAAYTKIVLANGREIFEVMTRADVEKCRQCSDMPNGATWREWWEEMAKKTCLRRALKNITSAPEAQRAAIADEYEEAGVDLETGKMPEAPTSGGNDSADPGPQTNGAGTPPTKSLAQGSQQEAASTTPTAPAGALPRPTPAQLLPKARDLVARMNPTQREAAQKLCGLPDLRTLRTADAEMVQKFIAACERSLAA